MNLNSNNAKMENYIVKVTKTAGNPIIQWLNNQNLINHEFKIVLHGNYLYIPVLKVPNDYSEQKMQYNIEFISLNSTLAKNIQLERKKNSKYKVGSLKENLKQIIPKEFHEILPRSFDIIGEIAIIELNREVHQPIRPFINQIADLILKKHPNIKSVYEKASVISGIYRIRNFNFISGVKNSATIHKENKCRFFVDIKKSFFTPRLAFERLRVSSINTPFNTTGIVWDMFCGVGPFLIQIAKSVPNGNFIGTDINPEAIKIAQKNISLNKINSKIQFFTLDAANMNKFHFHKELKDNVSRIIMNLPEKSLEFIQFLPPFIHKEGTLLHIYQFNEKEKSIEKAESKLKEKLNSVNLRLSNIIHSRIVKPFSPALDTTVIDAIIERI